MVNVISSFIAAGTACAIDTSRKNILLLLHVQHRNSFFRTDSIFHLFSFADKYPRNKRIYR